ncbi:MAG: amidohydrolase [Proteobacteria bacterium]|nr:amidohydrolase [Pseudomonadota bacterium]
MRAGYRIVDADRHIIEPVDLWQEYLEPEFIQYAPSHRSLPGQETMSERVQRLGGRALVPLPPEIVIDGQPIVAKLSERARIELALVAQRRAEMTRRALRPDTQLVAMDEEGVDIAYLYPTIASFAVAVDSMEPAVAAALARAYNNWLHDFCSACPERLRGVGLISRHDPQDMVSELQRIAGFGWTAVVLRPNPVKRRTLSHPDYETFWTECERRSIAVSLHEGTHTHLPTTGYDRFSSRFALHACSHPMEQMMALLALIEGGVLDRHPGLRIALLEAGCGWLPYWLWRLDEVEYKSLAGEVEEHVRMKPSEYFRRQCFVTLEPEEPYLEGLIRFVGQESLLFGSDFPHFDHESDALDKALGLERRLSSAVVHKMVWHNPHRFYRPVTHDHVGTAPT